MVKYELRMRTVDEKGYIDLPQGVIVISCTPIHGETISYSITYLEEVDVLK